MNEIGFNIKHSFKHVKGKKQLCHGPGELKERSILKIRSDEALRGELFAGCLS